MQLLKCNYDLIMKPCNFNENTMKSTSLLAAISGTLQSEGVKGLFAGYYATLVRDVPYTMLELGIYENMKTFLLKRSKKNSDAVGSSKLSPIQESAAAAFTGAVAALFTTPLDLVKTKLTLQVDAITKAILNCTQDCIIYIFFIFFAYCRELAAANTTALLTLYSGMFASIPIPHLKSIVHRISFLSFSSVHTSLYKKGGINSLFVGATARIAWLVPFTIIYLGTYEFSKRWFISRDI